MLDACKRASNSQVANKGLQNSASDILSLSYEWYHVYNKLYILQVTLLCLDRNFFLVGGHTNPKNPLIQEVNLLVTKTILTTSKIKSFD